MDARIEGWRRAAKAAVRASEGVPAASLACVSRVRRACANQGAGASPSGAAGAPGSACSP